MDISRTANESLQKWIQSDLYFFKDSRGVAKLFLRRKPVMAAITPGSLAVTNEVQHLIARLAEAANISHELTTRDVNLAIVVDSPINEGDKPNPRLWKRVGLSEDMYTIVSEAGSWASGCGIYSFNNRDTGEVGLSITFADSKLDPASIRNCVIEGTIKAFGLRANRRLVLRAEDGYIQFVALAKALSACEKMMGAERLASMDESEQREKYARCASNFLDKP